VLLVVLPPVLEQRPVTQQLGQLNRGEVIILIAIIILPRLLAGPPTRPFTSLLLP
jgi:hypothetical protein